MNRLALRRRLLVAESDLNRLQLARDAGALGEAARTLVGDAASFGRIASIASALVSTLMAGRRSPPAAAGTPSSWLSRLLSATGLLAAVWRAAVPPRAGRGADPDA